MHVLPFAVYFQSQCFHNDNSSYIYIMNPQTQLQHKYQCLEYYSSNADYSVYWYL